jgi:hypothetical protein
MAILPRHNSRFVVCVLLVVIISSLYHLSSNRHDDLRQDIHQVYQKLKLGQKQVFIQTATQTAIDGPFDDSAIKSLCASKNWTEGLIATCGTPQGGVSNVRNVFLNCVRYSIEAGGKFPQAVLTKIDTYLSLTYTSCLHCPTNDCSVRDRSSSDNHKYDC